MLVKGKSGGNNENKDKTHNELNQKKSQPSPGPDSMVAIWGGHLFLFLPLPFVFPLSPPLSFPLFLLFPCDSLPLVDGSLPFCGAMVKKGTSGTLEGPAPLEPCAGPLPVPIVTSL